MANAVIKLRTLALHGLQVACLLALTAPETVALEKAGVSAAVRGQVARANDEHPVGLQIASGEPIYLADRITSGPGAGMQIMLLDQTTFTIGPDSFVRIDEFVYDPNTNLGKVTATLGKGVFRFVTGKIAAANPSNMTVKLPNATIGIRGTMVIGSTNGEHTVVGLVGPGPENNTHDKVAGIDVITPNGTAQIRRPGWGAIIERGQAPQVQQLPKPTIDGILDGVAPRDVAQQGSTAGPDSNQSQTTTQSSNTSTASANNTSGQSSASAGPTIATFEIVGGSKGPIDQSTTSAALVGTPSAITTFDQLRAITSGTALYFQNNVPMTGDGGSGTYDFQLTINFGAQTGTASWGNILFHGNNITTDGQSIGFFNKSYANATGDVSGTFGANQVCATGVTCVGTLSLQNSGATIAAVAVHTLTLTDVNGNQASGGGKAPRQ